MKHVENVETVSVEKRAAGIVPVKLLFHKALWKTIFVQLLGQSC